MKQANDVWVTIPGTVDAGSNLCLPAAETIVQSLTARLWLPESPTRYGPLYTVIVSPPDMSKQAITTAWWSLLIDRPGQQKDAILLLIRATLPKVKDQDFRKFPDYREFTDLTQEVADLIVQWIARHRATWTMAEADRQRQAGVGGFPQWIKRMLDDRVARIYGPTHWPHTSEQTPIPDPFVNLTDKTDEIRQLEETIATPGEQTRIDRIEVFRTELTMDSRLLILRYDAADTMTKRILALTMAGKTQSEIATIVGVSKSTVQRLLVRAQTHR